jgi:hypothetical protein
MNKKERGQTFSQRSAFITHEEGNMECPFLRKWLIMSCTAGDHAFVVSSFVARKYCKGEQFKECPFYVDLHVC